VGTAKEQLRRSVRRVRDSISADAAGAAADAAARHLLALERVASARTVALYAPVRGELDPGPAGRALADTSGVRLVYPRVLAAEKRLEFHQVALASTSGASQLRPGAFGILEPPAWTPVVALDDIDVFVVPGLAFDHTGARLGWGLGFYDRTLARAVSAVRVGYCYACQIIARVPTEAVDLPMHYLVTDAGASNPGGGGA
jgi:5-formyltetrahydrofolate cyclo-ligase